MNSTLSSLSPVRVVNADLLRHFQPLASLPAAELDRVANSSRIDFARHNETLFADDQAAGRTIYLLEGTVTLFVDGKPVETFAAGTERAARAILDGMPDDCVAHADANLTLLSLDNRALASPLRNMRTAANNSAIDHAQWLKKFLRSNAFLKLPAANLQTLIARLEEVPVRSGQVIIHQGGSANNYYIIKSGTCRVLRQIPGSEDPLELAALEAGDGFGEDALITRGRRNASVIMLEDGVLMRLSRHNFTSVLVNPVLNPLSLASALQKAADDAVLLDVRAPNEFRRDGLEHAINIPLPLLRANLDKLDKDRPHIAYCNSGNLSAAAAFLLAQRGIVSHIIAGGLRAAAAATTATRAPKTTERAAPKTKPALKPKAPKVAKQPETQKAPEPTLKEPMFRDDLQLWTSIPTTENVDPAGLRVVDATPTIHSVGRNSAIRCVETPEDATSIAGEMAHASRQREEKSDHAIQLGWVSDQFMWETALGYRRDPGVEAALGMTASTTGITAAPLAIQPRHEESSAAPNTPTAPSLTLAAETTALGTASIVRAQAKRRFKRLIIAGVTTTLVAAAGVAAWFAPEELALDKWLTHAMIATTTNAAAPISATTSTPTDAKPATGGKQVEPEKKAAHDSGKRSAKTSRAEKAPPVEPGVMSIY